MISPAQILRDFTIAFAEPHDPGISTGSRTLAASILGSCLIFISGAVVNVSLASIARDLSLDAAQIQWLVNAEILPLAALSIVGGTLGDRFGRKRIFILGIAAFGIFSCLVAFAQSWPTLLAFRLLQGVSGALILPNGLTIIGRAYSLETKSRAVGIWSASIAVAAAISPALAGFLLESLGWRWVFLMSLPLIVVSIGLAALWIPANRENHKRSIDVAAAVLSSAILGALGFAFTDISNHAALMGLPFGCLLFAAIAGFIFVKVERARGEAAMLPPGLFRSTTIFGISAFTVLLYGAFSVVLTLIPYTIIRGAHMSTIVAGLAFIPLQVLMTLISPLAPRICRRIGHRYPLAIGAALTGAGCLLGGGPMQSADYWSGFFPSIVLISIGLSLAIAPLTTLVLTSVREEHSGIAAGFNGAMSRVGSLLGVALLGRVLQTSGAALIQETYMAMRVCSAVCILAALCVLILIPKTADF